MCGIVGVMGKIWTKEENLFKELLLMNTIRGWHGTGVLAVPNSYNWYMVKKAGNAFEFKDLDSYHKAFQQVNQLILGHNRMASKGKVSTDNSHPFHHYPIIGMHNGTVWNTSQLNIDNKKFDTDSEGIFYSIAKNGIEETWKNIDGAAVLVYWHETENTLNIISNGHRPFHFSWNGTERIFFSSERGILNAVFQRNDYNQRPNIFPAKEHTLYTFSYDKAAQKVIKETRKLEAPKPKPVVKVPWYNHWKRNDERFNFKVIGKRPPSEQDKEWNPMGYYLGEGVDKGTEHVKVIVRIHHDYQTMRIGEEYSGMIIQRHYSTKGTLYVIPWHTTFETVNFDDYRTINQFYEEDVI